MDVESSPLSLYKTFSFRRSSINSKINSFIPSTPKKMKKRSNIPPPLELDQPLLTPPPTIKKARVHDLNIISNLKSPLTELTTSTSSPTLNIRASTLQQKKSYINETCCICDEPLLNKFSNEKIIELNCDHQTHYNCYSYLLQDSIDTEPPQCSICNKSSIPKDPTILDDLNIQNLIQQNLASNGSSQSSNTFTYSPYTPQNQIIESYDQHGFKEPNAFSTPLQQEITDSIYEYNDSSPILADSSNYSIEDLIKPQVHIIPETNKLMADVNDSTVDFNSVLNISTTKLSDHCDHDDEGLRTKINNKIIKNIASQVLDLKGLSPQTFQNLKIFDSFEISMDGLTWEKVQCFVFQKFILILNSKGDEILGTVLLDQFHKIVQNTSITITLIFSTQSVPELTIRSKNKILLTKWFHYFDNKINTTEDSVPIVQITTNLWWVLDNDEQISIPEDIIKFNELSALGLDLPFGIMEKLLPRPKRLDIYMILVVSLNNNTGESNDVYLKKVQGMIRETLRVLNPRDKLGLVILGRNGQREAGSFHSSFFGMIGSSWSGWDEIINELQVYNDLEIDELNIGLKTCEKLLKHFLEFDSNTIKKIVMLNNNEYVEKVHETECLSRLYELGFSIHHCLIGSAQSLKPGVIESMESLGGYKYELEKFDNLSSFTKFFEVGMFNKFSKILLPDLKISLSSSNIKTSDFITISKFEQNCELKELTPGVNQFDLSLSDIIDGYSNNFKFQISLDLQQLQRRYEFPLNEYIEIPILNYEYQVLNETYQQSFNIKLKLTKDSLDTVFSPIKQYFQKEEEGDLDFIDIPIYAPLSSFKDPIYVLKNMELMILENLQTGMDPEQIISMIYGMRKELDTSEGNSICFNANTRQYDMFNGDVDQYLSVLVHCLKKCSDEELKFEFIHCFKTKGMLDQGVLAKFQ